MPRKTPATWFNGENNRVIIPNCVTLQCPLSLSGWIFVQEPSGVTEYWGMAEIGMASYNTIKITRLITTPYLDMYVFYGLTGTAWLTQAPLTMPLVGLHHYVVTLQDNGTNLLTEIWFDGARVGAGSRASAPLYQQGKVGSIKIAHYGLGSSPALFPQGCFFKYSLYNQILSASEIQILYRRQRVLGAIGEWVDGLTPETWWRDLASPPHHGTVYGSPERCRVHRRGDVQRWNGSAWYSVT